MQGCERVKELMATPHNQPTEGRKRENSGRQKERADYVNKKALALQLK